MSLGLLASPKACLHGVLRTETDFHHDLVIRLLVSNKILYHLRRGWIISTFPSKPRSCLEALAPNTPFKSSYKSVRISGKALGHFNEFTMWEQEKQKGFTKVGQSVAVVLVKFQETSTRWHKYWLSQGSNIFDQQATEFWLNVQYNTIIFYFLFSLYIYVCICYMTVFQTHYSSKACASLFTYHFSTFY